MVNQTWFKFIPFADLEAIAIVGIVIGIPLMIPIIRMLLTHQSRMAQLISQNTNVIEQNSEVQELVQEVRKLRDDIAQLNIANDDAIQDLRFRIDRLENQNSLNQDSRT